MVKGRRLVRSAGAALLALALLGACGGGGGDGPPGGRGTGSIAGSVSFGQTGEGGLTAASAAGYGFAPLSGDSVLADGVLAVPHNASALPLAPVNPGEVLVAFTNRELGLASAEQLLHAAGYTGLQHATYSAATGYHLFVDGGLDGNETVALAEELSQLGHVSEAIPNWRLQLFAQPDDEFYPLQWHYPGMNMPAAWDVTTGTGHGITVAVVDSGGVPGGFHPDLAYVGGYNFVSGSDSGHPNPGRGPDYSDYSQVSHGVHVAGTIAASSNNGIGVAGVHWGARLVAVRTMNNDGSGSMIDIFEGAWWAAGVDIPGVPRNPNPARIVNMSLGGNTGAACPQEIGNMFQYLASEGVIFVVAAGNDDIDTATVVPANCPGVITVGATGPLGDRTPYSNYGDQVDVMAPGGDITIGFRYGGEQFPAGVLSTILATRNGEVRPAMTFYEGTSMSSPHVAGVVALMLELDPWLTFTEVVSRLHAASVPLTSAECRASSARACGAGLLDAAAALAGLGGPGPGPGPGPGEPPVTPQPPPGASNLPVYVAALAVCNPGTPGCSGGFDYSRSHELQIRGSDRRQPYLLMGVKPGVYIVAAWQPLVDLSEVRPGDPFGVHPDFVSVNEAQHVAGIHVRLEPLVFGGGRSGLDAADVRAAINGFREYGLGNP